MEEYLSVLKQSELDLVREIEPDRMEALDEDELLELHRRARRARNKQVKNYRRRAAEHVQDAGSRGAARATSDKQRLRVAALEETLARVSARLAHVAHEQAELLKKDRIGRARAGRSTGPSSSGAAGRAKTGAGKAREHTKTTGGVKKDASTRAQGARRQATKDAR